MNIRTIAGFVCLLAPYGAHAETINGFIKDRSGAAIAHAKVGLYSPVGLEAESTSDATGAFRFAGAGPDANHLVITAEGFETKQVNLPTPEPVSVELQIAPVSDAVRVIGSTMDVTGSEQASSVSVITGEEIRERNEAQAADLLRILPGVFMAQQGPRGGVTTMSIRGGNTDYTLVEIDGAPVNSFFYGGLFDFAQVVTDDLAEIDVVRGAQSALYGPYANGGVINFVTRQAETSPAFDLIAEGGSLAENRVALTGSGTVAGLGIAASLSRISGNGEVPNADWRDDNVMLHVNRNWGSQSFSAGGVYSNSEVGDPGPYGSDPAGLYGGIDLISRDKVNDSEYNFHYQDDIRPRLRAELFGSFFLGNDFYASPYGNSFNKDIHGQGEARVVASVTPWWTLSGGFVWGREEVENTYVTDVNYNVFPLRRDEEGIYWENRFQFHNLYVQAGVRGDIFNTARLPSDPGAGTPEIPAHSDSRVDPKIAAGYWFATGTRIHASFGTGIRPPGGEDLAFTDNPNLKPERTTSVDAGISQKLLDGKLVLEGTFFNNRYSDLIVSLGGNLADLSAFQTDNLANARSRGVETSIRVHPLRWVSFMGNYTYLDTAVLALNHTGLAQEYYTVGQQLPRRPPQSGSFRLALSRGRISGDVIGYMRGKDLDVEPNYGASEGFYTNPGYVNLGVNLNVAIRKDLTVYGSLRNALDQHYEEIFGFPSPRLNFVSGLKWSFRGRDF
jgi:outer membrane cobalamin receptor